MSLLPHLAQVPGCHLPHKGLALLLSSVLAVRRRPQDFGETLGEEASRRREQRAAENLALVRNLALNRAASKSSANA